MKRLLIVLLFFAILAVPIAASAQEKVGESTITEGLRDKGVDWLKDKAKEAGEEWVFGVEHSDTMHDILEAARTRADGFGNDKNGLCQGAVMGKASSILANLHYTYTLKTGGKLAFDTLTKLGGLASGFGAAAGEGDAINWLVEQYTDAAKDQAKDSAFDAIKKFFIGEKKPEIELYEDEGKNGDCEYKLRAEWDIVHGTYRVYIEGDCHCTDVGNVLAMKRPLGQWWISFEGHLKLVVDKDSGTAKWVVLEPQMDFDAQCACSKRALRRAFTRPVKEQTSTTGGGSTQPSGPPPLPPAGRKVCKDCQKIQDEIDADQKALSDVLEEVDQLNARKLRAEAKLGQHEGSLDDPAAYGTTREALQKEIEKDKQELKAIEAENSRLLTRQVQLMAALRDLGRLLDDCIRTHCNEGKPVNETTPPQTPSVRPENKKKGVSYEPRDPFASRILDLHNAERAAVGAPPLEWNPVLAEHAMEYARQIAQTGQLVHAPREGRGIERENLGKGRIGWSPQQIIASEWTSEKRDFVPGYYPNVARDGNWLNVSHYTQMIWPTTTDIGCGYAEGGGYGWLVCRYSPGGNKDGKPVGLPSGSPERG